MIKLFDKDGYRNRGHFLGWGSGPDADWKILFSIFLFLLILAVAYCASVFLRVSRGDFGSNINSTNEPLIDKSLLQKNVQFYKDRKAGFEVLKTTKETTPDPSI